MLKVYFKGRKIPEQGYNPSVSGLLGIGFFNKKGRSCGPLSTLAEVAHVHSGWWRVLRFN